MRKTLVVLVSCALFSGCIAESMVEVRPQASGVKLVREDDKPFRCKIVGDVHGTSRAADEAKAHRGAENDMKNQAASLKANYAMIEIDRAKNIGTTSYKEVFLGGKALVCDENPG